MPKCHQTITLAIGELVAIENIFSIFMKLENLLAAHIEVIIGSILLLEAELSTKAQASFLILDYR